MTRLILGVVSSLLLFGHLNLPHLQYSGLETTPSSRCLTDPAAIFSSLGSLAAGHLGFVYKSPHELYRVGHFTYTGISVAAIYV